MSVLHYIDNEVSGFGEWTSVVEAGSSTVTQVAAAAFPERGSLGARVTISGANSAFGRRETTYTPAAGEAFWVAWWMNIRALPGSPDYVPPLRVASGGTQVGGLYLNHDGRLRAFIRATANDYTWLDFYVATGQWNYFAVKFVRSTGGGAGDGGAVYYLNGAEIYSNLALDTDARYAGAVRADLGVSFNPSDGTTIDFDEVKLASGATYPEPYVPTPLTDYPEARRTVVLYRMASADSREFAEYCVTRLGIPRCNVWGLPNATADETLADYATYETQVLNDLGLAYARHPTIAAQVTTFLLGYGVPGYYSDGGDLVSGPTTVMRLGKGPAKGTDNPFYGGLLGEGRISKQDLTDAGGLFLATRIDADSLANAKAIVDAGLRVAGLAALTEDDYLLGDQADVRTSPAAQRTRLLTAASYTDEDVALVIGDIASICFGNPPTAGSRAVFIESAGEPVDTLRSIQSELVEGMISNGWAAGLGWGQLPGRRDVRRGRDALDRAHRVHRRAVRRPAYDRRLPTRRVQHISWPRRPGGNRLDNPGRLRQTRCATGDCPACANAERAAYSRCTSHFARRDRGAQHSRARSSDGG